MSSALRLLAASAVSILAVVPITAATLGKKISGQSYFGTERYVDYISGDRPIILTSPYGGRLKTDPLPERADAVTTLDAVTRDLGRASTQELADADTAEFLARTGHRVHLAASQRLCVNQ